MQYVNRGGPKIVGRWLQKPRIISGEKEPKALLHHFANAPTKLRAMPGSLSAVEPSHPDGDIGIRPRWAGSFKEAMGETVAAVLQFTLRWGTLTDTYQPGEAVEFNVFDWCREQSKFRGMWEAFGSQAAPANWRAISEKAALPYVDADIERLRSNWAGFFPRGTYTHFDINYHGGEDFGRTPGSTGHLRIGAHTILHFLTLSLFASDGRYLRRCWRPDCPTPYFVASDLRQHYCTNRCSQWGRTESKRAWWGRSGQKWRRSQAI